MCQCEGLGALFPKSAHTKKSDSMLLLLQDDGCLTGKCAPAKSKGSCSLKQNLEAHRTLTHIHEK